jgi:hypothetical protein
MGVALVAGDHRSVAGGEQLQTWRRHQR